MAERVWQIAALRRNCWPRGRSVLASMITISDEGRIVKVDMVEVDGAAYFRFSVRSIAVACGAWVRM
jgi:hypothetical protein